MPTLTAPTATAGTLCNDLGQATHVVDQQDSESWHTHGLLAYQRGDFPDAIEFLQRAVQFGDGDPVHWNDLGVILLLAGRVLEAISAFERAILLRPEYYFAINNLGTAWQGFGDLERAAEHHRNAVHLNPGFVEAYNNLGNAFKGLGKLREAITAYRQALALCPEFAIAQNNLGLVLQENGDVFAAAECYRQALRLQPDYADASNNLATALKEQGLLEESLEQYRATLRMQPDHVLALYNLSEFTGEGRYSFSDAEVARLKTRVEDTHLGGLDRSVLGFALATILDKQGATDEAFAVCQQANQLRRESFAAAGRAFDPDRHRALVDRIIAVFDRDYFRKVQGWGVDTEVPVFIVGMPRSGSTLLEQILSSHPDVHGAGESRDFIHLMVKRAREDGSDDPEHMPIAFADLGVTQDTARTFLDRLTQLGGTALRVTDKTLSHMLYLGTIATMFPRARILHCRRDPLDMCASCYFQNFQHVDFAWSLEDIAAYYLQSERLMAHWRHVLPLRILEVVYEDLIANQEIATRAVLSFCDLTWDDRCLAFQKNPRVVQTMSTLQVRQPLSGKSVGRWRRYRAHLEPLITALGIRRPSLPKRRRVKD